MSKRHRRENRRDYKDRHRPVYSDDPDRMHLINKNLFNWWNRSLAKVTRNDDHVTGRGGW